MSIRALAWFDSAWICLINPVFTPSEPVPAVLSAALGVVKSDVGAESTVDGEGSDDEDPENQPIVKIWWCRYTICKIY